MTTDSTRIYVVEKVDGSGTRLVRASHKFGAHRHVTLSEYGTRLATQSDLERLIGAGVKVENAKADPDTADMFEGA
jgi:hypothetical protein